MSAPEHIAPKPLSSFTRGKIQTFSFQWKDKQQQLDHLDITEMAASIPLPTFEELRNVCAYNRGYILLNVCANCSLFDWKQVESESLQKCGRCKVLEYCSQQCQAEHWALVHKAHCKKMSLARQQRKEPVGIFSHHPFPHPEAAGVQSGSADTTEVLVALVQRFLMQIKSMVDPALFLHIYQLPQLEDVMEMNRRKIWAHRKLYPEQYKDADILDGFSASYPLFPNTKVFAPYDEASLETWSILHLLWGRLIGHWVIVRMNSLKDPRQAMPQDAWEDFIEDDVGLFPVRPDHLLQRAPPGLLWRQSRATLLLL